MIVLFMLNVMINVLYIGSGTPADERRLSIDSTSSRPPRIMNAYRREEGHDTDSSGHSAATTPRR
jgi:hypothetical protein